MADRFSAVKCMKKFFLFLLFIPATFFAQSETEKTVKSNSYAKGFFFSIGLGPRAPVGEFSISYNIGMGLNFEASFAHSDYLPFFAIARIGYESYNASPNYIKKSEYASLITNLLVLQFGSKIFLPSISEDIGILMPTVEFAGSYAYKQLYYSIKSLQGFRDNFEWSSKFGGQIGFGISMFIMEIMGYYNFYSANEYLSLDLKIRVPISVSF